MEVQPAGAEPRFFPPAHPDLEMKRVVVTGASLGVGAQIVRAFAANRARLVLQLDRDRNGLLALAHEIGGSARGLRVFEGAFRAEDGIVRFVRMALGAFGGIDVLVNNLGPFPEDLAGIRSETELASAVAVSLRTAEVVSRALARHSDLLPGSVAIINVLSLPQTGWTPAGHALYAMARTTLETMTRADAKEWGDIGLRVNSVVVSPEGDDEAFADGDDAEDEVVPLADEVVAAVLSLASSRSRWMNGLTLTVTGMPG
jgi:3-oxoacyl-[acyl-carrier protein] reductase